MDFLLSSKSLGQRTLAGADTRERERVKSDGMDRNQDLTAAGSPGTGQEEAGGYKGSQWPLRCHQPQR